MAGIGLKSFKYAKLNADDLDLILVSTITPNTVIPSTACEVQKELGAVNATCFDISAACSGVICGFGTDSYRLGIEALAQMHES